MSLKKPILTLAAMVVTAFTAVPPSARAAMPVIDVGAIAQLVKQVTTMKQQLDTIRSQLEQARQEYASITGGRGMERLLGNTLRNYLPPDWAELEAVVRQASTTYGALAANLQVVVDANAFLTRTQVDALMPRSRSELEAARRSAALFQVLSREALANTSNRFQSVQRLIDAIPGANDQKAILDLQARIQAEQGMLANEQTKLQMLLQAAQAEELARKQRLRERAIAGIGSVRNLPPMGLLTP